jgi:hypothetical protein
VASPNPRREKNNGGVAAECGGTLAEDFQQVIAGRPDIGETKVAVAAGVSFARLAVRKRNAGRVKFRGETVGVTV